MVWLGLVVYRLVGTVPGIIPYVLYFTYVCVGSWHGEPHTPPTTLPALSFAIYVKTCACNVTFDIGGRVILSTSFPF
jgi:hypothetical protein